jgi:hypothetical protein
MLTISALTGTSCIMVTLARLPAHFILPAARSLATATASPQDADAALVDDVKMTVDKPFMSGARR